MANKKVFITRQIPKKGIDMLVEAGLDVEIGSMTKALSQKEIIKRAKGAEALLCLLVDKIDEGVLASLLPELKIVANYAVGYDNVDVKAAKERGIVVTNTPGVLTDAVAEHTVALTLALAKRLVEADNYVRAGKYKGWEPDLFVGGELKGKVAGIVGHGRIGCQVAEIFQKGFGMKILYHDANRDEQAEARCGISYATLHELANQADVISLHVPLLPATHHLIGEKEFGLMKPTAYLVNTSRGPIVDEKALVSALKKKQIAGAGLDVYENEPKLTPGLAKLSNVILTPHTASATKEARETMAVMSAQNIIAVLSGQTPPNAVEVK
ncbi:MAG: D-glycerate dehydrogenase [Candidatus Wildermuthbacteria bacterium]|nr:D-glycerate dehydrogenase [Candidatus Wildermuthbacteria bacterium]